MSERMTAKEIAEQCISFGMRYREGWQRPNDYAKSLAEAAALIEAYRRETERMCAERLDNLRGEVVAILRPVFEQSRCIAEGADKIMELFRAAITSPAKEGSHE